MSLRTLRHTEMILDSKARYQEKSAREILSEIQADVRNRRWKDDKGQDPVALVAGLHGRSSSNYRHMAFCSGSFAHRSYFDLFCRECGFVRKKSRYQTASPKGIRENGVFPWKNVFGKSVCMAGIWRSRSAQMGKSFYWGKRDDPDFLFPGRKGKAGHRV